jgi:hypothetical protein
MRGETFGFSPDVFSLDAGIWAIDGSRDEWRLSLDGEPLDLGPAESAFEVQVGGSLRAELAVVEATAQPRDTVTFTGTLEDAAGNALSSLRREIDGTFVREEVTVTVFDFKGTPVASYSEPRTTCSTLSTRVSPFLRTLPQAPTARSSCSRPAPSAVQSRRRPRSTW